ncbi:MAG: biotin/lipoyl-containing protein [Clostridia bacterium]
MRNFKIKVNGQAYEVEVEEVLGGATEPMAVVAPAAKVSAPVVAPAPVAAPKKATPAGVEFKSPLPGMIVEFKVPNGATVKKGQNILVIEAMKMEHEIGSPADGVITQLVAKGANVESGDVLAVIA